MNNEALSFIDEAKENLNAAQAYAFNEAPLFIQAAIACALIAIAESLATMAVTAKLEAQPLIDDYGRNLDD